MLRYCLPHALALRSSPPPCCFATATRRCLRHAPAQTRRHRASTPRRPRSRPAARRASARRRSSVTAARALIDSPLESTDDSLLTIHLSKILTLHVDLSMARFAAAFPCAAVLFLRLAVGNAADYIEVAWPKASAQPLNITLGYATVNSTGTRFNWYAAVLDDLSRFSVGLPAAGCAVLQKTTVTSLAQHCAVATNAGCQ